MTAATAGAEARRVEITFRGVILGILITLVFTAANFGESLFNVALSGLILLTNKGAPLALLPEGFALASALAIATYAVVMAGLYGWAGRRR